MEFRHSSMLPPDPIHPVVLPSLQPSPPRAWRRRCRRRGWWCEEWRSWASALHLRKLIHRESTIHRKLLQGPSLHPSPSSPRPTSAGSPPPEAWVTASPGGPPPPPPPRLRAPRHPARPPARTESQPQQIPGDSRLLQPRHHTGNQTSFQVSSLQTTVISAPLTMKKLSMSALKTKRRKSFKATIKKKLLII